MTCLKYFKYYRIKGSMSIQITNKAVSVIGSQIGVTPLYSAIMGNHLDTVKSLIKKYNANPNDAVTDVSHFS